jgi:putative restriction endonuclease
MLEGREVAANRDRFVKAERLYTSAVEQEIRLDIFRLLDERQLGGQYEFTRDELANFYVGDTRLPLIDRGRGIRNPANFESTLSILTSVNSPYADILDTAAFVKYDYRAGDSSDNKKLRRAFQLQAPLI